MKIPYSAKTKNSGVIKAEDVKFSVTGKRRNMARAARHTYWIAANVQSAKPAAHLRLRREVRLIRARISSLVTPGEAKRWFTSPNERLLGLSPKDAIALRKTAAVMEILAAIEEGIYV